MQMKKMLQKKKSLSQKTGMTYLDTSLLMPSNRRTVPCILKRTLLIIGMVLMSLGVYAQSTTSDIPAGLKMKKTWVPDNDDNTSGKVVLETYVTGSEITANLAVPNDIVLVVDQSGSMSATMSDGRTRLRALQDAVDGFITSVYENSQTTGANHKIAIVGFASGTRYFTNYQRYRPSGTEGVDYVYAQNGNNWRYFYGPRYDWTNTELLSTETPIAYGTNQSIASQLTQGNYRDALVTVNIDGNLNSRLNNISDRIEAGGGTCMQYGLEMAYGVLSNRTETTFETPQGPKARGQIVVFFTDGYPGMVFPKDSNNDDRFAQFTSDNVRIGLSGSDYYHVASDLIISQTVADAAVAQANNLKNLKVTLSDGTQGQGTTIYSIGVFDGAAPTAGYQTNPYSTSNSPYYGTYYYNYWNTAGEAANGLMHMISSNYDTKPGNTVGMASSWTAETTNASNGDNRFVEHEYTDADGNTKTWKPKYFSAQNSSQLSAIFSSIAEESGAEPLELSAGTVVQDEVSANFTLPEGANINDIEIYAVKCTGGTLDASQNVTSCTFETEDGDAFGTKTTYAADGTTIRYLTLNADGVVVEGNNLPENRLESTSDLIQITTNSNGNDQISLQGFNFANMFCGPIIVDNQILGWQGRKLVIKIPIEVADGVWGDGVDTNGPMSFVLPDGGTVAYSFECPIVNVMGSVWTEVITTEPDNFDPMNIDSPEDLAWFISCVNGRIHYNNDNNVASTPDLDGKLTADIDMSAHNWVPIGAGYKVETYEYVDPETGDTEIRTRYVLDNGKRIKLAYEGEFDGNGHVITGLKNNADKWYKTASGQENAVVVYPGMFSNVSGTVHDVFVLDADFRGKHHNPHFIHHGILADTLTGGLIYNCEAAGRLTCNNDAPGDVDLIYGGLVGLNRDGGTIHSSMAMATLTAYTLGGGVGENRTGSFKNSFTNGVYNYLDETGDLQKPVGGLAGINSGTIDNCYVRFERYNENLDKATFDQLVASGTDATNCYTQQLVTWSRPNSRSITTKINTNTTVPNSITEPVDNPANSYTINVNKTFYNMFTNDNMIGGQWGTLTVQGVTYNVYNNGTSLVDKLNAYVDNYEGDEQLSSWKRTTAGSYDVAHGSGDINDDFPVLQLPGYTCLASADGIRIDYAHNLSDMLHRHNSGALNENTHISNKYTANNPDYYKVTDHAAINGGSINLFVNEDNRSTDIVQKEQNTDEDVVVYIDENISLLQDNNSTIEAYTGQTLKSFVPDGKERWHLVSSSLENSKFGISYGVETQVTHNWYPNPCNMSLAENDEDHALFPIDLGSYIRMDFYCFLERAYHWINFRRNKLSHWHMDNYSMNIPYPEQESEFVKGKGYLLSIDMSTWASYDRDAQFLQNRGFLNNGDITIPVTCSNTAWTGRQGYNLLGNPYQSYLDFDEFVRVNSDIMGNSAVANTFAVYDPAIDAWRQYKSESSKCSFAEGTRYLNMHQGFFIQVMDNDNVTFNNDMRTNDPGEGFEGFRGEQNNYPLINFIMSDENGNKEIAVLEVGRPENDGAKKLFVSTSNSFLYLRHDSEDYAILFRDLTMGSQPLYFEAKENGTFTLSWNTANANFSSLTLVDNITGRTIDMLANDSYTFEGNVDHYKSRFKVIFGRFTGIDEDMDTASESFAYFDGSEWIVEGQGSLTVTDMMGRTVYSTTLSNEQNRVNLNGLSQGVYLMRIADSNNTMVQKIVVK